MKSAPAVLCVAAILIAALTTSVSGDCVPSPCSWQTLRDQLQSRPFDASSRDQTLLALKRMVTSHVFNDISINSEADANVSDAVTALNGKLIPMKVDIAARLEKISSVSFNNDAALQEAIADVYVPLHDAHTRYNKPAPYRYSVFTMPFQLQHRVENGQQVITLKMRSDWNASYTTVYGVQPIPDGTVVDGWYVTEINQQPALSVLLQFATDSIGYTKDVGSRFNLAVHGYGDGLGYFSYRSQTAFPIPTDESLSLVLTDPTRTVNKTVSIKWLALYRPPATLQSTQYHEAQELQATTQLDTIRAHARHVGDAVDDNDVESALVGADVTWSIDSEGVLILRVSTFGPSDYPAFIHAVENAVAAHKAINGTRLVIDFRANGGGDICLGYAFVRFLFPQLTQMPGIAPSIVGKYDMAQSELFSSYASHANGIFKSDPGSQSQCAIDPELVGYFTPCAWHDPATRRQYVNDSFMNPGVAHPRGGISSKYTQLIQEGCEYQFNAWTPPFHNGYTGDNVVLISDGLCGSTCSVVSSFIQLRRFGKTLVLGGIYGSDQMFWSFPGGEVTNDTYVRDLAVKYQLPVDSPLIPPSFPNNASHRFAIRELYPWVDDSATTPMEFLFFPAHFHAPYSTNFTNTVEFYASAKALLSRCVSGVGDSENPCSMSHGTGYYACGTDSYRNNTDCRVNSCDAGYYRATSQSCSPCAVGTYRSSGDISKCSVCTNAPSSSVLPSGCHVTYNDAVGTAISSQCSYSLSCDSAGAVWKYVVTGAVAFVLATIISCAGTRYLMSRKQSTIDYSDMDRA